MEGYRDAATQAALDRMAEEARAEAQRAEAREQAQYAKARQDLEREKHHLRLVAMSNGFSPEEFDAGWPQQLARLMQEKQDERRRQQQASSVLGAPHGKHRKHGDKDAGSPQEDARDPARTRQPREQREP